MIKIEIEIVTGFLGSGKTRFINTWIQNTAVVGEKILVLQWEEGETAIDESSKEGHTVLLKTLDSSKPLSYESILYMLTLHTPHRVIVEYNGTKKLEELWVILEDKKISRMLGTPTIFHITQAFTFEIFMMNMRSMLEEAIYHSDLIIINNMGRMASSGVENIQKIIRQINDRAILLKVPDISQLENIICEEKVIGNKILKKCRVFLKQVIRRK